MINSRFSRYLLIVSLLIWGLVTTAALAGMYKLWWDRERVNYLGKTVHEQRIAIWNTSGLPGHLLTLFETLDNTWPDNVSYSASGDHNQISYLKYLLIPRLPNGSKVYSVEAGGAITPVKLPVRQKIENASRFPLRGFILSLLVVLGLSMGLKAVFPRIPFSLPEMCGCICLLLMGCAILARVLLNTAVPAFYFLTVLAACGWLLLLMLKIRKIGIFSQRTFQQDCQGYNPTKRSDNVLPIILFVGIIVLSLTWVLLMSVIVVPDDWDAWAIWAAKAKILALGHGPLFDVSYFGHADYPLLWPSVWAFSGWLGGGWEEIWSRGWGTVFFGLCLWEIVVVIERETERKDLAFLGGALFASIPMTPLIASWSYAEAPFWLMTTASVGCILLWRASGAPICIFVAAVLAAAAAYTKNEGVLFFLLASLWLLLIPDNKHLQVLVFFVITFLVLYLPWMIWIKIILGLGSHATAGLHLDYANLLRIGDRIPKAFDSVFGMWSEIKRWNIVLWAVCILAFIGCMRKGFRRDLLVPGGMILGYLAIIIFHTEDIYWQIGTSWDRLTVQAMPLFLIILVPGIWGLVNSRADKR